MIKILQATKTFKNKKRLVKALSDIDLAFPDFGMCFIVGPSGAGKSTLLNILCLQEKLTSGTYLLDGKDVNSFNGKDLSALRSEYFGIIFQDLNLIDEFTVYENIIISLELQKKKVSRDEVMKLLVKLNLPAEILDEKPVNLSGGQKQRIAIARSLIKHPKILICDEPTGSLDSENAQETIDILHELSKNSLVIVVTHDQFLSEKYADRIINIQDGSITADSNPFMSDREASIVRRSIHRSSLPLLSSLKIAIKSLSKSISRLMFAMISVFLTISMFMLTSTFYFTKTDSVYANSLSSNGIKYVNVAKYLRKDVAYLDKADFSEKEILYIENTFQKDYIPIKRLFQFAESPSVNGYSGNFNNTVSLDQNFLNSCGYTIIGRLPEPSTSDENIEIALTSYECYLLGWINKNDFENREKLETIIDEKNYLIPYGDNLLQCKIVGIIDTKYIFPDESITDPNYQLINDNALAYEMHCDMFISLEDLKTFSGANNLFQSMYVKLDNRGFKKVQKLSAYLADINDKVELNINSRIEPSVHIATEFKGVIGDVCLAISIVLIIIAGFAYIGFIRSSIDQNTQTVRILRSLGMNGKSGTLIFIMQSVFISLISVMLATIPYLLGLWGVNKFLQLKLFINITLISFSFSIYFLTLLGILAISIATSFLLSIHEFRKKTLKIKF